MVLRRKRIRGAPSTLCLLRDRVTKVVPGHPASERHIPPDRRRGNTHSVHAPVIAPVRRRVAVPPHPLTTGTGSGRTRHGDPAAHPGPRDHGAPAVAPAEESASDETRGVVPATRPALPPDRPHAHYPRTLAAECVVRAVLPPVAVPSSGPGLAAARRVLSRGRTNPGTGASHARGQPAYARNGHGLTGRLVEAREATRIRPTAQRLGRPAAPTRRRPQRATHDRNRARHSTVNPLGWLILAVTPPLAYGLFLVFHHRARKRQQQAVQPYSVASIAARMERQPADRPVRWPRADPDSGVVRDDRPTTQLPALRPAPQHRHRRYVQQQRPPK
ncbi:hypothetical protein SAMN05216266_10652 [Amycolatopsis marina]|uniref:Uncharacterized protein n=1 Tax=Amycolatopsis marina TaxID=490629 RepID=A0A1I0Z1Q5_9PSEU|nr:hypothetical protein SAMN05216266_10652 [Amycolatopsis marina]